MTQHPGQPASSPTSPDAPGLAGLGRSQAPLPAYDHAPPADHNWLTATTGDMVCSRCLRRMVGLRPVEPCNVRDGYWTAKCMAGCNGTGRYQQENLPDYLPDYLRECVECVECKGTGRIPLALAKPEETSRG